MAQERLALEPEVQEILSHIDSGDNFLLSGGAGSGKTYSLVGVIRQVISENPTSKIACITYTNAAVREIEERVNHKNLVVSTIHDFLWDNIKHFQKELKSSLVELMNDEESKIKNPEENPVPVDYFDDAENGIQYKEYLRIKEGIISHDEVLILANHLFKRHSKLCDILKDKFQFIFIDEYQDTNENVVEILLTHLKQSEKKNILGFFGDSMQSIYDDGIGDLNDYRDDIKEVQKKQNRRNPQLIINLANILRKDIDGIEQEPSKDTNAPNMRNGVMKNGDIKFYYSDNNDIEHIKSEIGWGFEDNKETKILNLTHNLIAPKAGFENLMSIYNGDKIIDFKNRIKKYIKDKKNDTDFSDFNFGDVVDTLQAGKTGADLIRVSPTSGRMQEFISSNSDLYNFAKTQNYEIFSKIYLDKDQLVDDKKQDKDEESKKGSKRDDLIKHLFKIQHNIFLYNSEQFNEFIRKTEYKINNIADKVELKKQIEELTKVEDKTIEEIINKADEYGICKKDDKLIRFIDKKEYIYNRVKQIKFSEFQMLYNYLEGYTPLSTQHKTKGNEFDNVLVILDNGGWRNYNFENLFTGGSSKSVEARTQKIFYVCCTRAKENLAIFFYNPTGGVINKVKKMFGDDNVCKI
ncbi:ATP-dependent helicase [candidate division WOR-3 bacterium]|nr:ATP-dependent helicase [candidate division WOR-3 bacterium]